MRNAAPPATQPGRSARSRGPVSRRIRWGTIRPTKPIEAAHRGGRSGRQGGQDQDPEAGADHRDADRECLFFAEQHRVETAVEQEQATNPDDDGGAAQLDMFPGLVANATDQPEEQLLNPVNISDDHHQRDAGDGHTPDGNSGQ